jgi:hypothetical protein
MVEKFHRVPGYGIVVTAKSMMSAGEINWMSVW